MPLQIRRGTDAERLLLAVPLANGELLWTTDSKKLFIGDGTTVARDLTAVINYNDTDAQGAAGILIASASTTDISFTYNSVSNSLTAAVNLSAFRQDVNMGGFSLNGIGNINIDGDIRATGRLVGNYSGSLFGDDSTLLVDGTNSVIVGPIDSPSIRGNLIGNVLGDVTGTITGTVNGDIFGSVFANDSTTLVDAIDGIISNGNVSLINNLITNISGDLTFDSNTTKSYSFSSESSEVFGPILEAFERFKKVELRTFPNPRFDDFNKGDISSALQFSFSSNSGGAKFVPPVTMGAQIDRNAGTESLSPTKFWVAVFPEYDIDTAPPEDQDLRYLTFDPYGQLGVNIEEAQATLDVNGFAKLAILSSAPSTPLDGMIAIADGDGWDPLGVGSPAKQQMVVYLGGGWRQLAQEP